MYDGTLASVHKYYVIVSKYSRLVFSHYLEAEVTVAGYLTV